MSVDETRAAVQRQLFLRTIAVARPVAGSSELLARMMRDVSFQQGDVLYTEGDAVERIYFIVTGAVELRASSGDPPLFFDDRSVVGVLDMIRDERHSRTAVALTDVHALVIRSEDWLEMLEDNFEFARGSLIGISTGTLRAGKELGGSGGFEDPSPGEGEPVPVRPLNFVERMLVLRELPAFARTRTQALTSLAEISHEMRLEAGEVVFEEGREQTSIFVLGYGSVELTSAELGIRARLAPRSLLGGYAALSQFAGFTARALTPSLLLGISRDDLFDVMEDHFEVTRSMFAFFATERSRLTRLGALAASTR